MCTLGLTNRCKQYHIAENIDRFWVIAPIYAYYQDWQPVMYEKHMEFKAYVESLGAPFCSLEAIRVDKGQIYKVTRPQNEPYDIQMNITEEFYLRENFINVAVQRINQYHSDWDYISWIDSH